VERGLTHLILLIVGINARRSASAPSGRYVSGSVVPGSISVELPISLQQPVKSIHGRWDGGDDAPEFFENMVKRHRDAINRVPTQHSHNGDYGVHISISAEHESR
jgi:hypothetical protein